ncbi:acetyltransferase (GNAT) family protein [Rhodovulum euryhalinum]|uniref:Acetyltransferase (GNAT) family protein n=2 Tax=Rhodovulum euryhalinum TaxID=35805 RepID=A0A4R2KD78_9RHOB|nr:acetyltransferase (GNAT) family protein [Rhodovulum euryhalinum]
MAPLWTPTALPCAPDGAGLPMQQHPAYGMACATLGSAPAWFEWREGSEVLATAQVLSRRWPLFGRFALLSRGPAFAPGLPAETRRAAIAALLTALARDHRGVLATPDRIAGADPLAGGRFLRMVSGAHVARLSLEPDADRLRAGLHQKWRNRLKRAEAGGLALDEGDFPDAPDHWLLREEAVQAHARRYARLPPAFALAWARLGETLLVTATRDGRPQAGMLFLIHRPWASYHLGWTSAEGRRENAHTLMLWRAIVALKARGITALELGVLDTVGTPDLARFKLGTGAAPVQLGATWMDAPGSRLVAALTRGLIPAGASRSR